MTQTNQKQVTIFTHTKLNANARFLSFFPNNIDDMDDTKREKMWAKIA